MSLLSALKKGYSKLRATASAMQSVMVAVALAVMIPIAFYIFATVAGLINTSSFSASLQNVWNGLVSTLGSAFSLLGIVVIVIAAVVVIALLVGALGGRER